MHAAAYYGQVDAWRLLLHWGAKAKPLDSRKLPRLHHAARSGNLSAAKLFVEMGADVRLKNEDGQTTSDVASSLGRKAVAEWLYSV
jgi:ankyrin repeat protein